MSPRRELLIVTILLGGFVVVTTLMAVRESSWRIAVAPLSALPLFLFFAWSLWSSRRALATTSRTRLGASSPDSKSQAGPSHSQNEEGP